MAIPSRAPKPSEIISLLRPNPDLEVKPNDMIPQGQSRPDIGSDDALSAYLQKITKQDIQARDSFGFVEKQTYNDKAYFEIKDDFFSNWPHPNASNFPEPITSTLVDVGWAHIQAAMFRNPMKTVLVGGIGKEDKPYAPLVAHVMNFENGVESEVYDIQGTNAFRTLLRGTGFVKTWLDMGDVFKIRHASIPMQLVYKPVRGNGCQRDKCDHITQFIPMTEADWKFRIGLTNNGKKIYENLDMIAPGFDMAESLGAEEMQLLANQITGMDIDTADKRDLRWMAETKLTYYPPGKFRAIELIVWWSLRHGLIHRVIENEGDNPMRDLADYWVYPSDGYAYQRSLPDVIRHIQEKANYTDKQVTDAADNAINPPGFIDKDSGFDPQEHVLVPNGMYEVRKGTKIQWKETNISSIVERGRVVGECWEKAKIRTGFTDVFMGMQPDRAETFGAQKLQASMAQNRFKTILNTFGIGWRRTCEIQYDITNKNIPRKKLMAILGSSDYTNTNQLFPASKGGDDFAVGMNLNAKLNFAIAGKSQTEADIEDQDHLEMTAEILKSPFGQQPAVAYRCLKKRAEIRNFQEYETIVPKPPEADIMTVDEVLQRIESGETELQPSPIMELPEIEYYMFRFGAFKRTERYRNYTDSMRVTLERFIFQMNAIKEGKVMANWEKRGETDPQIAQALDEVKQEIGTGQVQLPGNPAQGGGGRVPLAAA